MSEFIYEIYIGDDLIDTTELRGIAFIKFEQLKSIQVPAKIIRRYVGEHYDPVLHSPHVEASIRPSTPCQKNCPYRKSKAHEFYNTPRRTAFRTEVIAPSDRCGYMLKPGCMGGGFFDYFPCDYCKA